MTTPQEIKAAEKTLTKLQTRQTALQEARDKNEVFKKKLKKIVTEIEAINIDTAMPMPERRDAMQDLKNREAGIHGQQVTLQTEHGSEDYVENELERIADDIGRFERQIAEGPDDNDPGLGALAKIDKANKKVKALAAKIDDRISGLGDDLAKFWDAHRDLQAAASAVRAPRNRGAGMVLNQPLIDSILQAQLYAAHLQRSLRPDRPGPGFANRKLADAFPKSAGEFIGELPEDEAAA